MNFKGTKTEENLMAALKGESLARNQYTFFEEQARKEGNEEIAELFKRMALNETMHAKMWFRLLNDGLGDSASNLLTAAGGEGKEWRSMYPGFAATAREEGLEEIALFFEQVARIECDHEKSFLKAYANLKNIQAGNAAAPAPAAPAPSAAAPTQAKTMYCCMFCGSKYDKRPDVCPFCEAIGSFEEVQVTAE